MAIKNVQVIGIMSGTSLDGLDIAHCTFPEHDPAAFRINNATTYPYSTDWHHRLAQLPQVSASELVKTQYDYSRYVAEQINQFISGNELPAADLIAFHGHTIFHTPEDGITFQLGSPAILATATGIATAGDFRTGNVILGGQGAPLVPIGDLHLFPQYDACLNLGGFGNISLKSEGEPMAFDICAVNMALNELAGEKGKPYDEDGNLASSGHVNEKLLMQLNQLLFYQQKPPKSLGREWYEKQVKPLLTTSEISTEDKLATYCEHIALQISHVTANQKKLLITGGGARNKFLTDRIRQKMKAAVTIPEEVIIDFKEALVFAYLGFLRMHHTNNCLKSYTGSSRDHCAGSLHMP